MKCGLGLLCSVAERCLEEEVVEESYEPNTFSSVIEPVVDGLSEKNDENEDLSDVENLSNGDHLKKYPVIIFINSRVSYGMVI